MQAAPASRHMRCPNLTLWTCLAWVGLCAARATAQGVLVGQSERGTPADGPLAAGDRLLSWNRDDASTAEDAHGTLESPFDLAWAEIADAQRGPIVLDGVRNGQPLHARVEAGEWKLRARPVLAEADEAGF